MNKQMYIYKSAIEKNAFTSAVKYSSMAAL